MATKDFTPSNKTSVKPTAEVTKKEEPSREHIEAPPSPSPEKVKLINDCAATIREFQIESNIPITHKYWDWKNQIRSMK